VIFIAGATGFVGRHLLRGLSREGHGARCLVRNEHGERLCSAAGFETCRGDITDRESLKGKLEGASTVIHLVGIIKEGGGATFDKVHVEGTRNLVEEAKRAGAGRIFYQSALGAALESPFGYLRTKAEAEEIVRGSGIPYIIFRPSLIIGPGDGFTENVKGLLRLGPVVPVPGDGEARFQPLFIEDWIRCLLKIMNDADSENRTFEFGGPEHLSYNDMLKTIMRELGVDKPIVHIPPAVVKAGLPLAGVGRKIGLKVPDVGSEQIDLLQVDNITDTDSVERLFGFRPIGFEEAVRKTLGGQPDRT